MTAETTRKVLDAFKKGEKPKPGPQSGRHTSENSAGLTALAEKVRRARILLNLYSTAHRDLSSHTAPGSTASQSLHRLQYGTGAYAPMLNQCRAMLGVRQTNNGIQNNSNAI